ncbi:sensor histidine kinase [Isoptericola sp. BMS4]|uniref:sensor histidine kinase n=1 Tax=Isoptericola sp. BMS4 TaxID=2527875 RepID=UPI00141D908B|nr:histidine kinase [Isoptericola sp. BMS4]
MTTSGAPTAVRPATPGSSRAARLWGETWRLLAAAAAGFLVLVAVAWEYDTGQRDFPSDLWAVDVLVGVLGLPLLLLRRRAPLVVAVVLAAASAVSVSVAGATAIAVISLATHRRWWSVVAVGVVFNAAGLVYGALHPPAEDHGEVLDVVAGLLSYGLLVWIGAYIGLRREHLASLQERAETAEREQASRAAEARANERARIAREMHDVLAHRMSLVAMHAGALAYRTDLPREQVAETAKVVQQGAHDALTELREVLGVLRETDGAVPGAPEPPQPTLADLDELFAEARRGGTEVRYRPEVTAEVLAALPESVGRNAYRVVQEGLTNARKHAPWAPVTVLLAGTPGDALSLTVRNPVRSVGPPEAGTPEPASAPASGLGLVGLTERAELAGGHLRHGLVPDGGGEAFLLEARLPWPA